MSRALRAQSVLRRALLRPVGLRARHVDLLAQRALSVDIGGSEPKADLSQSKSHTFQAETSKLLQIVASSLYSEREVFVRELVSNASDALEKLRYLQATGKEVAYPDLPLEITITTNEQDETITITDTGIGMTEEEVQNNLGTIARSGSKEFMEGLAAEGASARDKIIGQFGVGFYSGFMAGDDLTVYTQSADAASKPVMWHSQGLGDYTIAPASNVPRGTSITIKLRDDAVEFADENRIKEILRKYSNFVGFPVKLNEQAVNTIQPLWTMPASQITDEQHDEFYRFISNGFDKPTYKLQYSVDAPLMIRSLLYIPSMNMEKYPGAPRTPLSVSLYCRKVLISNKLDKMFPDWMRFVKGVVDSEDIPLNLSREMLQDSALVSKIGRVLTGRVIKFLGEQMAADRTEYEKFYAEFNNFLVEGICTDNAHKDELAKLMLFQSSKLEDGKLTSFEEYTGRMAEDQKDVYYVVASSREAALQSPYMELMSKRDHEVLLLLDPVYELVMLHTEKVADHELVSIESSKLDDDADGSHGDWSAEETAQMCDWLKATLGPELVKEVKTSSRLTDTPAVIVDHDPMIMRQMMRMRNSGMPVSLPPQILSINPQHPLLITLNQLRTQESATDGAALVAKQMYSNAQLAAGLVDDPKALLPQLNELLKLTANKLT